MAASEDGAERGVFPHARARTRAKHAGSLARDTVESRDLPGRGRAGGTRARATRPPGEIRAHHFEKQRRQSFSAFSPFHKILKGVSPKSGPKRSCKFLVRFEVRTSTIFLGEFLVSFRKGH